MKHWPVVLTCLCAVLAWGATANAGWTDPGWNYVYNANPGEDACGAPRCPTRLDGTWTRLPSSCEWDGSAPGLWQLVPGGAQIVDIGGGNYALRVIDPGDPRDYDSTPDPSNRKIYSGHDLSLEGVDPAVNVIRSGVTIAFRFRQLAIGEVHTYDQRPDGGAGGDLDPGYTLQGNGKGPIGLVSRADSALNLNFTVLNGHLLGAGTSGGVAVDVPLCDPTGWVEVWAAIQDTPDGLHLTVFMNGSLAPVYDGIVTTLGNGTDDFQDLGAVQNYLFLGLEQTGQFGAFDFDYVAYKLGAEVPTLPAMADVDLRAFGNPVSLKVHSGHAHSWLVDGNTAGNWDTWNGCQSVGREWVGLDFVDSAGNAQVHELKSFIYYEGAHFGDGGSFVDQPVVEARIDGVWTVVSAMSDPPYYPDKVYNRGANYERFDYIVDPPVLADGVRLSGMPWGRCSFISAAELTGAASGWIGQYPDVSLEVPALAAYGDPIVLKATACDHEGTALAYSWDLDATDGFQEDAAGAEVTVPLLKVGEVTVTCSVADGDGNVTRAQAKVTVLPAFGGFAPGGDAIADAIDADGFIKAWLLLGPYAQPYTSSPSDAEVTSDFLTDGAVSEDFILPYEGMQVATDYNLALATGLQGQSRAGMNPGGIPTWFRWIDGDQTIDYSEIHAQDINDSMSYAVCYVNYAGTSALPCQVAGASDDSLSVIVNDRYAIVTGNAPRGYGGDGNIQDRGPAVLIPGLNRIVVKVYEGGGGYGFRCRLERLDNTPLTAADGLSVYLAVDAPQIRVSPLATSGVMPYEATLTATATHASGISDYYWDLDDTDGLSIDAAGSSITAIFDHPTTATVIAIANSGVAALATVKIQARRFDTFVDEFDGDPFTSGAWDIHVPNPWGITTYAAGGKLRIELPSGYDYDSWWCFDAAPKLIMPISGDWIIETKYYIPERQSDASSNHLGLLAAPDFPFFGEYPEQPYHCPDFQMYGQHTSNVKMERTGGIGNGNTGTAATTRDQQIAGIELRMEKRGRTYEYWYKLSETDPWTLLGTKRFADAKYVGLICKNWGNNWIKADFEYFRLFPAVYPATDLLCEQTMLDGTTGVLMQWQNNSAYEMITVKRNGVVIAELDGGLDSFFDSDPCPDNTCPLVYEVTTSSLGGDWTRTLACQLALLQPGAMAFQTGRYPDASYDGTFDAHIVVYRSWEYDDETPNIYNSGAHDHLEEGDWNGGHADHKEILIGFDISRIPANQVVKSASLWMYYDYCRSGQWVDHRSYAANVLKKWNEGRGTGVDGDIAQPGEVTWRWARAGEETWDVDSAIWDGTDYADDTRGGAYGPADIAAPEALSTVYGSTGGRWARWPVTNMVREWIADPSTNFGMKVTQNPGNNPSADYIPGGYDFFSRNYGNAGFRPMLLVEMESPICPINLSCLLDGRNVKLSWTNSEAYDRIELLLDGAVVGTVMGESGVIQNLPAGDHTVGVRVWIGEDSCAPAGCAVSIPLGCPSSFACTATGHTVDFTWQNNDAYDKLEIYEGVTKVAEVGGGQQSASLAGVAPGAHTYALVAVAGDITCGSGGNITCAVTVPTDCPDALACAVTGSTVTLTWDVDDAYSGIAILRDGAEIATVGGDVTSYVDEGVAAGSHTYAIVASSVNPDCAAVECVAQVGLPFKRGDANTDGFVDIADGMTILLYAFASGPTPSCLDAADTDDDGAVNGVTDAIYLFNYLFSSGAALPAPGTVCGLDGTPADGLGCDAYPPCE
ncbi:MAG: DNRLRE domain-containing protein [Planctomycetes bacterium]|nr:DNRLRE domain-containing protein [Planctomycetota bacterium]